MLDSRALNGENGEKKFPITFFSGRHCGREVGFSASEIDAVVVTCWFLDQS